ncbi:MAG: hypothetical protein KKF62_14095 [Bacteroidetes bacterium]|nr:hypothetical protein [Bacteroidota bacterium]MBU1114201.1 hypothetical protein [Bacteroidota bacterium]
MTTTTPVACKSCGAKIIFMRTNSGKYIPVNFDSVVGSGIPSYEIFNSKKHTSHFATCPYVATHRKKREN